MDFYSNIKNFNSKSFAMHFYSKNLLQCIFIVRIICNVFFFYSKTFYSAFL